MENKYFPPEFEKKQFTCPHCGVLANQSFSRITDYNYRYTPFYNMHVSHCSNDECEKYSLWMNERMVIPSMEGIPYPNNDLEQEIQDDYLEARSIAGTSPRGAAAILRLALQKLCKQLGEPGKNINEDIKNLVKKGLRPTIQQSLDLVRVTGNNAVHPGTLDMKDNKAVALEMFRLINVIADVMISEPKKIDDLYKTVVPAETKKAIEERDQLIEEGDVSAAEEKSVQL